MSRQFDLIQSSRVDGALSNRNKIINGAMVIDQRNSGAAVTGGFSVDRFEFQENGAAAFTVQRSTVAPAGFSNSVLVTVITAGSATAAQLNRFLQRVEGNNIADLNFGAASASTVTLSFWVRSSLTGTYCAALVNNAANRAYVAEYSISAADTWEYKTITIVGDTTGTWETGVSSGIQVTFDLGSGSNYNATAGSWTASGAFRTTNQVNFANTNGATFYITGVQLEAGDTATPFEHRSYGQELALCQRYYESLYLANNTMAGSGGFIAPGVCERTTRVQPYYPFKVQKRAIPSTTLSAIGTFGLRSTGSSVACTSGAFGAPSNTYAQGEFNNGGGGLIEGGAGWLTNHDGNAKVEWSAEL